MVLQASVAIPEDPRPMVQDAARLRLEERFAEVFFVIALLSIVLRFLLRKKPKL